MQQEVDKRQQQINDGAQINQVDQLLVRALAMQAASTHDDALCDLVNHNGVTYQLSPPVSNEAACSIRRAGHAGGTCIGAGDTRIGAGDRHAARRPAQLAIQYSTLADVRAAQQPSVAEVAKVHAQLDTLATEMARLAASGNANAQAVVDEMRRQRVTLHPPATPPAKAH